MLAIDRNLKPTHFLNQNDTPSSSKVNFGLSSMIYETVPTRVHPGKSPISCTNVVILSSEVKILLPFFFVCKDEWLGHNAHRIPQFDQQILVKIFLKELNFCPNQGTHTLVIQEDILVTATPLNSYCTRPGFSLSCNYYLISTSYLEVDTYY